MTSWLVIGEKARQGIVKIKELKRDFKAMNAERLVRTYPSIEDAPCREFTIPVEPYGPKVVDYSSKVCCQIQDLAQLTASDSEAPL